MGQRHLELLAPARDLACGLAAIDHGADAVYIGGPQFGARAAAANSLADLAKLVSFAHRFRAKVYVALNTVFSDHELPGAVDLAWQLHNLGVDALIIQDMGLLESAMPPIPLHASTQTNNRTVEKVRFLEEVGFQQVVLARELSLEQIRTIRAATSVALECFVHGALCVSYSGQCYMSEVVAGRSANRGECAQFCRHLYTLKDGRGKIIQENRYLLSLKDLDLARHLAALIDAGIDSFKIEGRLKDIHYVKNVTAFYRQALDKIIDGHACYQRASSGRCSFSFIPDTTKSFNRGQTEYYLVNSDNTPGAINSPKAIGQLLGPVNWMEGRSFKLDTVEEVHNGDGLCYFDPITGLVGLKVNRVVDGQIFPKDPIQLQLGTKVYRNADTAFSKMVFRSEQCRKIAIRMKIQEIVDGLQIELIDEDGITATTRLKAGKEQVKGNNRTVAIAEKQMKKSGGTIFWVQDVTVDLSADAFFPAAVFNELRREGFASLAEEKQKNYPISPKDLVPNRYPWPHAEVCYLDNIANHKALAFYRRHGVQNIDISGLQAANVPNCRLMTTRYCVKAQLGICPKRNRQDRDRYPDPLTLTDNTGVYVLEFDCAQCEMILRMAKQKQ